MDLIQDKNETAKALHELARKKMILRLLEDIRIDIEVCRLEGFEYKHYLNELKRVIDNFLIKGGNKNDNL